MLPALGSGVSAMKAIATRFSATAHNVANVNTDGFHPLNAILVEGGKNAGPAVHLSRENAFPSLPREAGMEATREAGIVLPSETDLAVETGRAIRDTTGYAANARQVRTQDEMLGSLLSIRE